MTDYKTMLAAAKRSRRSVPICLRGDLVAEFEQLQRQLEEAERQGLAAGGIEEVPAAQQLAERIEALREQMQASTYPFVVEALPGPAYRTLKAAHPPRQGEDGEIVDDDKFLDANYDTFLLPLFRASLVDPVLDDAGWDETDAALSDGQYNQLLSAALQVNRGGVDVPFSPAASRRLRSTEAE